MQPSIMGTKQKAPFFNNEEFYGFKRSLLLDMPEMHRCSEVGLPNMFSHIC